MLEDLYTQNLMFLNMLILVKHSVCVYIDYPVSACKEYVDTLYFNFIYVGALHLSTDRNVSDSICQIGFVEETWKFGLFDIEWYISDYVRFCNENLVTAFFGYIIDQGVNIYIFCDKLGRCYYLLPAMSFWL